MRSVVFGVLSVILCIGVARSQGFERVFAVNGSDVWAVGNGGVVFRSSDGGDTWWTFSLGLATLRSLHGSGSTLVIVGDGGTCYRSTDGGENFSQQTLAGGATLRAVQFANSAIGWIAGDGGVVLKTTNGGASWSSLFSSTLQNIHALNFIDANTGWYAGGTVAYTTNGGTGWTPVSTGISKLLLAIEVNGPEIYLSGVDATVAKSTNSGASWQPFDFKFDSFSDVNDVSVAGGAVFFCGGGGFIRKSTDGGASFTYPLNPMLADLRDIFFVDANTGWACSSKNNAIIRTTDGGTSWVLPAGTVVSRAWAQRLAVTTTVRGNTFVMNPWNKNTLYCALGTNVYASYNRGDTWSVIATMPTGGSKVNSFYVSPKDTNLWVAAYGIPDRIVRSTDRGATWAVTITKNFSEYGMPLEMDASHPDTLIFGPEDGKLWRSTNFGLTWDSLSHPGFRSPCDIAILRDAPEIIWVGDGVTGSGQGQMFRSTNGGKNFTLIYSVTGSEIPTIGTSSIQNTLGYATAWGSGGVMKTQNMGANWSSVATTGSTWGVDIAKDDPNVVMYGVYGGGTSYLSTNAGSSFLSNSLSGSNYALYCYDRGTFLAQQSGGIFKLTITYTVPTLTVPIQLASFTGRVAAQGRVVLEWTTISEINNFGFIVQRKTDGDDAFVDLPGSFVPGHGTTNQPRYYSYVDETATGGSWQYRLKQLDLDGTVHLLDPIHVSVPTMVAEHRIPTTFFLSQNYPNPFNPTTIIRFGIPQDARVIVEVFDALGQPVLRPVDGLHQAGIHEVVLDASNLAAGMYVYRLRAGEYQDSKRLLLVK